MKLIWYYIETRYSKVMRWFGITKDETVIPRGMYCEEIDEERTNANKDPNVMYYVKTCKYHRMDSKGYGIACTYLGWYGFDFCLYDQCKMCSVNDD